MARSGQRRFERERLLRARISAIEPTMAKSQKRPFEGTGGGKITRRGRRLSATGQTLLDRGAILAGKPCCETWLHQERRFEAAGLECARRLGGPAVFRGERRIRELGDAGQHSLATRSPSSLRRTEGIVEGRSAIGLPAGVAWRSTFYPRVQAFADILRLNHSRELFALDLKALCNCRVQSTCDCRYDPSSGKR